MRQTQRSPEGPRHLHRIPRLSEGCKLPHQHHGCMTPSWWLFHQCLSWGSDWLRVKPGRREANMANSHSTNTMLRSRLNAGPQKAASGLPSSVLWVVCCVKVQPRESGAPLVSLRLLVAEEDFFFFFFFEFPVVTRESRRNSRKTTWVPRHRKMRPLPTTASQEKSHVPY